MKFKYTVTFLIFISMTIYLFATAPQELRADNQRQASIRAVLEMINREHEVVRNAYTSLIVKPGKKVGLKFSEHWQDRDAGPLPAQFLRLTSMGLAKSKIPLGLYLGSDYPISPENRLTGIQQQEFISIKKTRESSFFYSAGISRYTYMVPDIAISDACTKCHNDHKDSNKTTWAVNDVMGAVTWTYPNEYVSISSALEMLSIFRDSVRHAYSIYAIKAARFSNPPNIGSQWPTDGYNLPTPDVFMDHVSNKSSSNTMLALYGLAGAN